jgi:anti-sigma regulatory factor (Ser/Thr protein kinase)
VKGKNLPLGFSDTEHYVHMSIPFEENDILFFYSDGISEARNQKGDFFGERRIVSVIEQNHEKSSQDIISAMKDAVIDFSGGNSLADDFTCVSVKMTALSGTRIFRYHGVFPNTIDALQNIRDFIWNSLEASPLAVLPQMEKEKIILAGHEAASNVIEHGIVRGIESSFYLELEISESCFLLRYVYAGKSFPMWIEAPEPNVESLQERGYGIFIIEQVMDSITYANDFRGGMMITLVKRFAKKKDVL